jgi:thioredoxin 1
MALFSRKPKPVKMQSIDELKPMIDSGRPVLLDFMQVNCGPCRVMDGIVNELAEEYGESAHIVKVDVTKVAGAAQLFQVRSTPTFVLLSNAPQRLSKKAAKKGAAGRPKGRQSQLTPRWRTSGLVKKDQLKRQLESNGAVSGS